MGIYVNPDNANFKETADSGSYVDKTLLLDILNQRVGQPDEKFICLSRPRRFGKTIAGNMVAAYYSKGADSKALFSRFKISQTALFGTYLNALNVIKIDLNGAYASCKAVPDADVTASTVISYLTTAICKEFRQEFPAVIFSDGISVADALLAVFRSSGVPFVIIIDEYDVLLREQVPDTEFQSYLGFLNSLFKNESLRPAIALAYLTGILPVIRDKVQSKLNTFDEITILRPGPFAEYTGFTDAEVKRLCAAYKCDFDECKSWYNGYRLKNFDIYNPQAVIKAVKSGEFASYWSATSTYEVISDKIKMNFDGIQDDVVSMLSGNKVSVNTGTYKNTMNDFHSKNDVFTFLIHLGYLAYDADEKKCYIPNREIHEEWQNAIAINADYAETNKIIADSQRLLQSTICGDEEAVAKALDISHMHVASNRSYNNEYSLQSAIYLAYIAALNSFTIVKEMTTGKGFADIVYIPFKQNLPAMIIELKHNKSAETALNQIKEKMYFDSLSQYSGNILFVGINYDEVSKVHQCTIKKLVK